MKSCSSQWDVLGIVDGVARSLGGVGEVEGDTRGLVSDPEGEQSGMGRKESGQKNVVQVFIMFDEMECPV